MILGNKLIYSGQQLFSYINNDQA